MSKGKESSADAAAGPSPEEAAGLGPELASLAPTLGPELASLAPTLGPELASLAPGLGAEQPGSAAAGLSPNVSANPDADRSPE